MLAAPAHAVVVYERVGSHHVMAARDDGTHKRLITPGYLPALSPNGKLVSFLRPGSGDNSELWVARLDGSNARRLLYNLYLDPHGAVRGWSPNSRYIVAGDPSSGGAYIVDLKRDVVHSIGTGNGFTYGGATFAPDSRRAVFEQPALRGASDLVVRDATGKHPRHVANGDTPLWGAGGLAFHGDAGFPLVGFRSCFAGCLPYRRVLRA